MYVSPQTDQGIGPYHVTLKAKGGGQRAGHFQGGQYVDCNLKVSWDIKLRYFKVRFSSMGELVYSKYYAHT